MGCKWLCLLMCINILAASNTVLAQTVSRKFKNQVLQAIPHGWENDSSLLLNANYTKNTTQSQTCHTITKQVKSLANAASRCMERIIFQDCCQPYFLALGTSGVYPIENGRRGYAYCDQSTDGGSWLVIARRAGGRRSFNKNWRHYKKGFGPLNKDFWLGLDSIVHLTSSSLDTELRFDIQSENGSWYYAHYNQMMVGPESTNYTLSIHGYDPNRSTIFDAFSFHNELPFSTKDSVNVNFDVRVGCRKILNETGAGWWWGGGGLRVSRLILASSIMWLVTVVAIPIQEE